MSEPLAYRPAIAQPLAMSAIGLLLLNDHVLKGAWPGPITGKLSDVAGLVFFPLLLSYLLGIFTKWPARRATAVGIVATGVAFSLIQVWGPAADLYRHGLGALQFPFRALIGGAATLTPVAHTADPADLLALPALLLAWWIGRRTDDGVDRLGR